MEIYNVPTKDFLVIDSTSKPMDFLDGSVQVDCPIYYIGPVKDTIRIGARYRRRNTLVTSWPDRFPCSKTYSERTLRFEVDTSQYVNNLLEYRSVNGRIDADSSRKYYAYLFTIKNISDSIVWIGRSYSIYFFHLEVKDRHSNWMSWDRSLAEKGICGTFEPQIYLKPGEIVVSKVALCRSYSRTDCRLAFGFEKNVVYSNVFHIPIRSIHPDPLPISDQPGSILHADNRR